MRKIILGTLLLSSTWCFSATPPTPAIVINNPDGRLQFYPRLSSTSLSSLLGGTTSQAKIDAGGGSSNSASFQNPSTGTLSMGIISGSGFGIANSTGLEVGQNWQLTTFTSTSDARGNTFVNFRTTTDANFDTLNSTIQAIVLSTASLSNKVSTATLVYNGGIDLTALVQGANITLTQSGSSLTVAGSAGGSGNDGFGNPVSTRPITAQSGVDASTLTVLGQANFEGIITSTGGMSISSGVVFGTMSAWGGFYSTATSLLGSTTFFGDVNAQGFVVRGTSITANIFYSTAAGSGYIGDFSSMNFINGKQIEGKIGTMSMISGKIFIIDNGKDGAPGVQFGAGANPEGFWADGSGNAIVHFLNGSSGDNTINLPRFGGVHLGTPLSVNDEFAAAVVMSSITATGNKTRPILIIVSSVPITSVGHRIFEVNNSSTIIANTFVIAPATFSLGAGYNPSAFAWFVSTITFPQSPSTSTYAVGGSTTGYLVFGSSAVVPHVLSSCGSSPSPTIYGGGNAFTITPGGTAGGCTVTFGTPFQNPPVVLLTERTFSLTNALSYTVTNTALTITETSLTSKLDVVLFPTTP